MRFFTAFLLLGFVAGVVLAENPSLIDYENNPKFEEVYRIKIWNQPGGTIEVSSNKGKTWQEVGRVIYPTQKTNPESYAASRWVADGTVAATAVNAIHVKTSTEADGGGVIFSLLPKEFLPVRRSFNEGGKPPAVYRSYLSPDSSIYTDIAAGESIFGGGFAPFVGNTVLLSRGNYRIVPIGGYTPAVGDKLYLIVERPVDYPKEIVFENRFGGPITITYFNGNEKLIGRVLRPVAGVGRFDGTRYASVGRIRADHAGVIDVSTSRLGAVGGFQIVPAQHGTGMEYVKTTTQWMVIGDETPLEGKAPFFKYFINPAYSSNDLENDEWGKKLLERFLIEVKVKGKNKWQPMPIYEFDEYYLTGELPSWANNALSEVTHVRILFPIK
jgi:hypothetical protein